MRELIPWWARIGAKIVLSRLPAGYDLWRRLNLFKHGAMHRSEYARGVFELHFTRSGLPVNRPFSALELGPGDSLLSALIAAGRGCTHIDLVDAGAFATTDMDVYRLAANELIASGVPAPSLDGIEQLADMLRVCQASYGTKGLESLRKIPSSSVDFVWSQAVLEHIRRTDFAAFMRETRRVLRPGGICSHEIDLKDHLGGALNNMRIGSRWWEAEWMARSGFYTNRLRKSEMLRIFEATGFSVSVVDESVWDALPTPKKSFAREFASLPDEELLVKTFSVVLTPA